MVNNTVYQFVGSNLRVEIFWKGGNIKKRVQWNRRLRLLCTLCIGIWRKFHLHFTLMFQLRYNKMVQSLYKSWLLASKFKWEIWTTSDKQRKVQKVEIWWATFVQKMHLSKKYIPSAKTSHTEDSSNITFNYLCENSPNYSCHFWNHKSFFKTQICIFFS